VACVEAVGELDGRACLIEEEARAGDVGQQLDLLSYVDAEQRGPLVLLGHLPGFVQPGLHNRSAAGPCGPVSPALTQFKQEVEKQLTGRETEPWEIAYFKLYKSRIPVIEQALETAALMLGTDQSRGYCLEMICAEFLAGANLENENPEVLLHSALRFFKFLPGQERETFLHHVTEKAS
jgi:hypothetical protein